MKIDCIDCNEFFDEKKMHKHEWSWQEYAGAMPQIETEYRCKSCVEEATRRNLPLPQSKLIIENTRGW